MLLIKESADGRYNQGLSLMALREYGKALESFQEAEKGMNKIVPASARSKITAAIAENYIRLTRYDQAQKKLRNYLTDNPDDARVLRTLRKLEGRPES
jgi:tetratricopeptide (TPR) repeat protein